MSNQSMDLCEGPLLKKTITYVIPVIMTGLLQLFFNAADLIVVGRFCGNVSVAAVGATSSILFLIINLFMGLSVGASVLAAQSYGARDEESLSRTVHTAIPTAVVVGAVISVVGIGYTDPALRMMGTPDDVIELSAVYMKIYYSGSIFSMLYNFSAAILRALGDTKNPLIYLTVSGVLNVILNVALVCVFNLNVAGVAIATVVSQGVSAFLSAHALMKRNDAARLQLKKMRIDKKKLKRMLQIGIPAGIQSITFQAANIVVQSSVNSFGSVVMAGSAASSNIEGFVNTIMVSFQQASMNFSAQNYGAKKYDRVKKAFRTCMYSMMVSTILISFLTCAFSHQLLGIYITDSAEAINYGSLRLRLIVGSYVLCGAVDVCTGTLRGLGMSIKPMAISVVGICAFRILWIKTVFTIPKYHTVKAIFTAYPLSYLLTLILLRIMTAAAFRRITLLQNTEKSQIYEVLK